MNTTVQGIKNEFQTWSNGIIDIVEYKIDIDDNYKSTFTATATTIPLRRIINLPPIDIELTERDLEVYQYFLLEFISLEIFPDEIRKIPENSKEELGQFWVKLIANPDFINQFFASIRSFYLDPNNLIPQLQDIVEEIRGEFSEMLPESKINNLESAVKEIFIPHPQPSMEEIFAAIKEAETPTFGNQENIILLPEIQCLSEEAKNWLRNLFIHLVQNPNLEPDVRGIIGAMNKLLFHSKKISNTKSSG